MVSFTSLMYNPPDGMEVMRVLAKLKNRGLKPPFSPIELNIASAQDWNYFDLLEVLEQLDDMGIIRLEKTRYGIKDYKVWPVE